MDPLLDILREAGQAVIGLFSLPYFYIAIALVIWHAKQGAALQRKLFHVRLYGTLYLTITRIAAGIGVGFLLSLAGMGFGAGVGLTKETLLFIWVAMAALALFRLRYVCLAYAAGALGLLQALSDWTGIKGSSGAFEETLKTLSAIDVPSLLFLAGLLHVAEGILVRLQGAKLAIPLFLQGKRGKPMGAYSLTGVWPIPLLWLIPASGEGFTLPWTPLFGGDVSLWSLLAFPVLIGFSDRTTAFWPQEKAKSSGNSLILYGIIVAALAAGAEYVDWLGVVAAVAAFALHEGVLLFSRSREAGRDPIYSQDGTGVKVLAVLPNTPAVEMGFEAGEVIRKANGAVVRNKEQLHAALQRQSAFCKLEVANRNGELRFVQRARYEGEHYQLGLILAPDEDVEFVAAPRSASIWQGLRAAGARRLNNSPTMLAKREAKRAEAEQAAAEQAAMLAAEAAAEPDENAGLPPRGSSAIPRKKG
ncbi:PDZ domain-containing protein [Cohnella endophytica]|uniref:PDZ domain-containing protein n=1 Tax=Cohnella endophytica TaxID=2419778 RepID=UPI0011C4581C|nr:PDZ domain-containing protein [Cohnella endophytica]